MSGTGTVSVAGVPTTLNDPTWGPESVYGYGQGITYSFDVTYKFIWVPGEDPDVDDGEPVAETRQLDYTGTLNWEGNSGFQDNDAGCSGSWTLEVTSPSGTSPATWSADMTSTQHFPDNPTITESGTWGDHSGSLSYTLSGAECEVRLNFQGTLTTSGPAAGSLALNAPAVGAPGGEGIWHLFPVKNTTYPLTQNLTQTGRWRGNSASTYRIRFAWACIDSAGNIVTTNFNPTGDLSGTGKALSWTGGTFTAINHRKHWSYAYLDKKAGNAYPNPPDPVASSEIPFQSRF